MIKLKWLLAEALKKENVLAFYKAICADSNIKLLPLKFVSISKGIAMIVHDKKAGTMDYIGIDMNKASDVEMALLHEFTHQLLILKNNDCSHSATFRKMLNKVNDKYMYSKFTNILYA